MGFDSAEHLGKVGEGGRHHVLFRIFQSIELNVILVIGFRRSVDVYIKAR